MKEVNFEGFGYRELALAGELLKELGDNGINNIELSMPVTVGFNETSGYVFLSDEDMNCVMFNEGKLENWVSCGDCGSEDFASNLKINVDEAGHCEKCVNVSDKAETFKQNLK